MATQTRAQHTPGPWEWEHDQTASAWPDALVLDRHGNIIAHVKDRHDSYATPGQLKDIGQEKRDAEKRANARLIAAAPELIEAAQTVMDTIDAINLMPLGARHAANINRALDTLYKVMVKAGVQF